ncbi:MAG: beta-lactamase family protein [Marinibacterium sp.]|nr:beta-lactamase family protein [Marinibacterium sp.]
MPQTAGMADARFQQVADLFTDNFASLNELGASLCVTIEGETVLDLWGGHVDAAQNQPWEEDTVCVTFSNTKAATAICVHLLIERGMLELDTPLTRYWPEFGGEGRENITVRMCLNHTAGLPAIQPDVKDGGFADWDYMTGQLAQQTPFWEPGTQTGYHMFTFGWLLGELVRRVSGRSLGAFFAEEIAQPLGLDFHIGLSDDQHVRVSPIAFHKMKPGEEMSSFMKAILLDTQSMQARALLNLGNLNYNDPRAMRAEIGAAGGIGNARALAGMFTPLATGTTLLSAERINAARQESSVGAPDVNLMIGTRFGQGFMLRIDNRPAPVEAAVSFLIPDGAFGHVGAGGSYGFADPDRGIAMSYVMNRMGGGFLVNARGQRLIDAVYDVL